uniref:Uncharacterized protein n=1 Tax=Arundo donax TaxID=35708 RepID=A0A0A9B892_ARUDO
MMNLEKFIQSGIMLQEFNPFSLMALSTSISDTYLRFHLIVSIDLL